MTRNQHSRCSRVRDQVAPAGTPVSNDGVEGSYNFVNFAGCVCLIAEVDDEETPPIALVNAVGGDDCAFITGSDNLINGTVAASVVGCRGDAAAASSLGRSRRRRGRVFVDRSRPRGGEATSQVGRATTS